jgi:hypothetical protein
MNTFTKLFTTFAVALTLSLALAPRAAAQTLMTNTTLTATVQPTDQFIYVASLTGITAAGSLNQPVTGLLIDREYMTVTTTATLGTVYQVGVNRIAGPTQGKTHSNGTVVWAGVPNAFSQQDPSGGCIYQNELYLPKVVIPTGRVWTCFQNGLGVAGQGFWAREGYAIISPANCGFKGSSGTDNGMIAAATGNVVRQWTTTTTSVTNEITCDITPPQSRLSDGRGVFVGDVDFLYGLQTTALTTGEIAAATVKTVTYPASTAAGAAAAGTVAAAGGTYTVTPTTLQLSLTTTGQCFNEKLTFGTPIQLNTDNQKLAFDQVFTNPATGSAATVIQVCGLLVHYYEPNPAF